MPAACEEPNFGGSLRRDDGRRAFQWLGFRSFAALCILSAPLCPRALSRHAACCHFDQSCAGFESALRQQAKHPAHCVVEQLK
jgi:hypothetical protein